jgi:hypothetical protein
MACKTWLVVYLSYFTLRSTNIKSRQKCSIKLFSRGIRDTVKGFIISEQGGLAFDNDASYAVMNDKVQALAGSIYEELERMITKYDQASQL